MKNKVLQLSKYLFFDILAAELTWLAFFIFRKKVIEPDFFGVPVAVELDTNFVAGFIVLPLFWVLMALMSGAYRDIYRKSRLKELGQTLSATVVGTLILFFVLFLDDFVVNYKTYYTTLLFYFSVQFLLTWLFRVMLTTHTIRNIRSGKIGFNTVIIGADERALQLWQEMQETAHLTGNRILGYIRFDEQQADKLQGHLPLLGHLAKVKSIMLYERVEEVIIATESTQHHFLQKLITDLDERNIRIRVIPDMYDILSGSVRFNSIFGAPLIDVSAVVMPPWQQSVKRAMDVVVSALMLVLLMPVFLILAACIKSNSKGPVFYSHHRIGRYGKPFKIYKFRSMYTDAEKHGPALSSTHDSRITSVGKVLRKYRLDELPQFYNVLIGDMSLVGPRPERQFFIDQIVAVAPHYKLLHRVRPGITSWGQVKFGYAENVNQMVERLKFDLLYIENMSLALDFKIIIYTVLTILRAEGK